MTDTRAAYADNVDVLGGGQAVLAEPGPSTIDSSFDSQRNSLNFLRIVLAIAVVFSHAISIGSFGTENMLGKTTLGTMAVYGFFGLSGYLITASASRNHVGRFLWKRFLRIYPAFWVCLTVRARGAIK